MVMTMTMTTHRKPTHNSLTSLSNLFSLPAKLTNLRNLCRTRHGTTTAHLAPARAVSPHVRNYLLARLLIDTVSSGLSIYMTLMHCKLTVRTCDDATVTV
jgi:hypothetical protein